MITQTKIDRGRIRKGSSVYDPRHDPSVFILLYLCEKEMNQEKRKISIAKWNMPKANFMH